MSQVVIPDVSQPICLEQLRKILSNIVGLDQITNLVYSDIINLPHHVSSTRPQMSMIDRAAQFSPFAALTGYDAAIKETGRLTDDKIEMDEEALNILSMKFQILVDSLDDEPEVTFTYFKPDERKAGGAYTFDTRQVDVETEKIAYIANYIGIEFLGKSNLYKLPNIDLDPGFKKRIPVHYVSWYGHKKDFHKGNIAALNISIADLKKG